MERTQNILLAKEHLINCKPENRAPATRNVGMPCSFNDQLHLLFLELENLLSLLIATTEGGSGGNVCSEVLKIRPNIHFTWWLLRPNHGLPCLYQFRWSYGKRGNHSLNFITCIHYINQLIMTVSDYLQHHFKWLLHIQGPLIGLKK